MYWINETHGMELTPIASSWEPRGNENGILFLAMWYLLKQHQGTFTSDDAQIAYKIITMLQTYDSINHYEVLGLFDRGTCESASGSHFYIKPEDRRLISHDNITGISRLSNMIKSPHAKEIADHLIKYQTRFDNAYPDSPRFSAIQAHPRDLFFWLTNGGNLLGWLFFPIFFMANIITCFGNDTSGKQLMVVRLLDQPNLLLRANFWICKKILKSKYGKKWLSSIVDTYYYQREDNPIRTLAKDIEL